MEMNDMTTIPACELEEQQDDDVFVDSVFVLDEDGEVKRREVPDDAADDQP